MANPKRKWSKARTARARSNWKLSAPKLVKCPRCSELKMPHKVCLSCGFYDGQKVMDIK